MKFIYYLFSILSTFLAFQANAQYNQIWTVHTWSWPIFKFTFDSAIYPPSVTVDSLKVSFDAVKANISRGDSILFYTNSTKIFNRNDTIMENGDSLGSLSPNFNYNYDLGFHDKDDCLILPKYGSADSLFYLFTVTKDSIYQDPIFPSQYYRLSFSLRYSVINMNANGGEGKVELKDVVVLQDSLFPGRLHAIRHANGRDWWILIRRYKQAAFYSVLLTPDTILPILNPANNFSSLLSDYIVVDWFQDLYKSSPDGSKFVQLDLFNQLVIFDFDRCSGTLSNPQIYQIPFCTPGGAAPYIESGVSAQFSPNSRFLYLSTGWCVMQLDMWSPNIMSSLQVIDIADTIYCNSILPVGLGFFELAPDGKIYQTAGYCYLHVIHQPDLPGLQCNYIQNDITLPLNYSVLIWPNNPNFNLGPLTGSPCDTLTGYLAQQINHASIRISPNPGPGYFKLSLDAPLLYDASPEACVYDITGRAVLKQRISAQVSYLDLTRQSDGIYLLRVKAKKKVMSRKLVKQTGQ